MEPNWVIPEESEELKRFTGWGRGEWAFLDKRIREAPSSGVEREKELSAGVDWGVCRG